MENIFEKEKIWRVLANVWTVAFLVFIVFDVLQQGTWNYLVTSFSAVYIGVLMIYIGTKEFNRWYEWRQEKEHHPGEFFIVLWTAVMLLLFAVSWWQGGIYRIPSEVVGSYIMVLSMFAITQNSKRMHRSKRGKDQEED